MSEAGLLLDTQEAELNPQTLSFQDFGSSGGSSAACAPMDSGRVGSAIGSGAVSSSMLSPQKPVPPPDLDSGLEAQRPGSSGSAFWSIKYYQPLFDVDTVQVLNRVKGSLLPRPKGAFFELVAANPDLYGPFWISTTLIFAMAITGNLASYFAFHPTAANPVWKYNFNQLTLAGSVVYSYVTVLPLIFWLLLRYFDASKKLVDVLCIYGYSLSVFIPISVICVLPSNLLRWLLVLISGVISAIFLLSNFHAHLADCFPYGEGDAKKKSYVILGGMIGCHFALILLFKFYFFHYPVGA
uniref:Protein YIPF n=2 Tax=Haptolina ericina TaxID=156174 RepID=A0A7S3AJT7_9EUKA|mmetsp:Transcript_227/g.529  ORF Transcript_227/g.529 Transcript_227/m.529 type:complete len:297 (+) Transcript_227:145-1035(+)